MRSWLKTSFVDYPGKIASVFFYGGCNFRCPFCHNGELVKHPGDNQQESEQEALSLLTEQANMYDGVCLTGGEPTLFPQLRQVAEQIKSAGLLVKLDTNGTHPKLLSELVHSHLVDYVAMDIKTAPGKYHKVFPGSSKNQELIEKIIKSVEFLKVQTNVDYEFRSTLYPPFFQEVDLPEIAQIVRGAKSYVLQQFDSSDTLEDTRDIAGFTVDKMNTLRDYFAKVVDRCDVRI